MTRNGQLDPGKLPQVLAAQHSAPDDTITPQCVSESIQGCKLKMYFNNVNGFISKNNLIKNSKILENYDLVILQETNLTDDKLDAGYLDFAVCRKTAIALSTVDEASFSRGMLVAWSPDICNVKLVAQNCANGFEIKTIKVESKFDHFFAIVAYCSPSQSKPRYAEFFSALVDCIANTQGKVMVIGDLNIMKKRKLHHFRDEADFLKLIEDAGLTNEVSGVTHPSKNNQLDYALSNIEGLDAVITDGFGDHHAFSIEIDVRLEIVTIPAKAVRSKGADSVSKETITMLVEKQVDRIIEADMDTGEAINELELFIWELNENLFECRIIPEHKRVRHCSRQMSNTILNSSLTDAQKRDKLRQQLEQDTARKLAKSLQSLDGSERLMSAFTLGSKKKPILSCEVQPEEFFESILKDEAETNAGDLPVEIPRGAMADLIKPLEGERLEMAVKKAKAKWIGGGFSTKFWNHIAGKLFTEKDRGVYSFAKVGTVIKDKTNYDEAKAWRMVWKASSISEKIYDLLRACSIDSKQLNNDAYCPDRSTQGTLSKASSWSMSDERAALGCDFRNAFGLANRSMVNELLGLDFLKPEIEFQVSTGAGKSKVGISRAGTGAGRPTGGPGFNILFEYHLKTHPTTKDAEDEVAPFADDSEIDVERKPGPIKAYIESFEDASKFGLHVHRHGKKGPTLLVRKGLEDETRTMLDENNIVSIIVTCETKFLGLMIHICPKYKIIVARFPASILSKLSFFVMELGRNFRVLQRCSTDVREIFKSLSNAVASLIESRIQYAIAFLDRGSICKAMVIHKRALCSLTGCSFRFFGFKNLPAKETSDDTAVNDLMTFLDDLESASYVKLCMILGRPTMKQMALRACLVIKEQVNLNDLRKFKRRDTRCRDKDPLFVKKIERYLHDAQMMEVDNSSPKLNDFHRDFTDLKTFNLRKKFIKAATDNLILHHLNSKGWILANGDEDGRVNQSCRFDNCNALKETLEHVVGCHGKHLSPENTAEFKKLVVNERKRGTKRPSSMMSSSCSRDLALTFSDIPEPFLRMKVRDGHGRGTDHPKKRRRKDPHPPPSSDCQDPNSDSQKMAKERKNLTKKTTQPSTGSDRQQRPSRRSASSSGTRRNASGAPAPSNPQQQRPRILNLSETRTSPDRSYAAAASPSRSQQAPTDPRPRQESIPVAPVTEPNNPRPRPERTPVAPVAESTHQAVEAPQSSSRRERESTSCPAVEVNTPAAKKSKKKRSRRTKSDLLDDVSQSTGTETVSGPSLTGVENFDEILAEMRSRHNLPGPKEKLSKESDMSIESNHLPPPSVAGSDATGAGDMDDETAAITAIENERLVNATHDLGYSFNYAGGHVLAQEDRDNVRALLRHDDNMTTDIESLLKLIPVFVGRRRELAAQRKRATESKDEEKRKSLKSSEALASIRLNRLYLRLAVARGKKTLDSIDEEDKNFQSNLRVKRAAAKRRRRHEKSAKKRAEASSGAGLSESRPSSGCVSRPSGESASRQGRSRSTRTTPVSNARQSGAAEQVRASNLGSDEQRPRFQNVPSGSNRFERTAINGQRAQNQDDLRNLIEDRDGNRPRHPMSRLSGRVGLNPNRVQNRLFIRSSQQATSSNTPPVRQPQSSPEPNIRFNRSIRSFNPAAALQRDYERVRRESERTLGMIQDQIDRAHQSTSALPQENDSSRPAVAGRVHVPPPRVLDVQHPDDYSYTDLVRFVERRSVWITNMTTSEAQRRIAQHRRDNPSPQFVRDDATGVRQYFQEQPRRFGNSGVTSSFGGEDIRERQDVSPSRGLGGSQRDRERQSERRREYYSSKNSKNSKSKKSSG